MGQTLIKSDKIWKLAKDLGLKPSANPVNDILQFCETRVHQILKGYECTTLENLLDWVAARLGTSFEEIHSDEDLKSIKKKYIQMGETAFAALEIWLTDDVCGITLRRETGEKWDHPYVSVIDCRGFKANKAYYTKWHELGHLLIITDQMRLCFKRTLHLPDKDPEEILVDKIAGKFGFYAPIILPHARRKLSFDEIDNIKNTLCPAASYQSTLIGFVNAWPKPCILLQCRMGLKKSEQAELANLNFSFANLPSPELRVANVTVNEPAKALSLRIFKNMRVPSQSIIKSVHINSLDHGEATEDLSIWETSDGTVLPEASVIVQVKRLGDDIYALVRPK